MAVFSGNGSATAPSFTFSSDTNLGIYRGGTDIISFTTAGSERANIDASGTLNIGGTNIKMNANGSIVAVADASIHSVTVGLGGGSVASNTAIGFQALSANTTGAQNTVLGYRAFLNNTEGINSTAVGLGALLNNTIGFQNTAVGLGALQSNIEGDNNTALGYHALLNNTTGNYNAALGQNAGYYIEGSNNTSLGAYQGT